MNLNAFIKSMKTQANLQPIIIHNREAINRQYAEHWVYYKGKAFPNKMRCATHLDAKARLASLVIIGEYPQGSYLK